MTTDSNIQEKINNLNEKAKSWGDSKIHVQKAIHDFGAENIYYIRWDYNSQVYTYHYYNAVTQQEFVDYTMSWAGPSDAVLTDCLTIKEAVDNKIFDTTDVDNRWQNNILLNFKVKDIDYTATYDAVAFSEFCIGLKVRVKGGRKYNGEGILIGVRKDTFCDYYGNNHTTYTVIVYDEQQKMIGEANSKYCTVIDMERYKKEYNDYLAEVVKKFTYGMKFNIRTDAMTFDVWLNKYKVDVDKLDKTGMNYPEERKRQRKADIENNKKTAEMARIKKWIAEKRPDITDPEEIENFAERIYKKNRF